MDKTKRAYESNLISIIVPVYNAEKYLQRCIYSIVNQSYPNLEIILVNDGSVDNSMTICERWAADDNRIKVIAQRNQGAATARNHGLDIAHGDYIMFVDSDDYIAFDICEKMLKEVNLRNDTECVVCGLAYVDDKDFIMQPQVVEKKEVLSGIDSIKDVYIYGRNRLNIIGPCGKLFSKKMWHNLRFTDGMYYEDLDIMPYLFTKCKRVVYIPDIGYYYYQRIGSASHGTGTDDKRVLDSLIIRDKHIRFFDELGEKEISQIIRKRLLELIITCDCNGWIPNEYGKESKKMFNINRKLVQKDLSIKEKLRFAIYSIGGAKFYKLLKVNR